MKARRLTLGLVIALVSIMAVLVVGVAQAGGQGVLRLSLAEPPLTLDPAATHSHPDWILMLQIYDTLIQYGPTSLTELRPLLAERVPTVENGLVSKDGLTYTFPLRRGVKFHDGKDFDAHDVVYTFKRLITMNVPQSKTQQYVIPYVDADGVELVDDYTVAFHLKKVFPGFIYSFCDPCTSILSEDYVEAHGGYQADTESDWMRWHAMGTGPFKLQEVEAPGLRSVLVRNEGYWGEPAKLEMITTVVVSDPSTQILMLINGEIDLPVDLAQDQLRNVENVQGVVIERGLPALRTSTIRLQQNINTAEMDRANTIPSDFFQNIRVRKAFAYAFPYNDYIDIYNPGNIRFAGAVQNGVFGNYVDVGRYDYDPDAAEALFRQTEWWDKGFTITAYTLPNWSTWPQAISMLAESLKSINPKFVIEMRAVEWATLVDLCTKGAVPIEIEAIRGVSADPDSIVRQRMYKGGWDTLGLNDPEVNELIDEAAATVDPVKRAELYRQLEKIAYETCFMLTTMQDSAFSVHTVRVQGLQWHPIFQNWLSYRSVYVEE